MKRFLLISICFLLFITSLSITAHAAGETITIYFTQEQLKDLVLNSEAFYVQGSNKTPVSNRAYFMLDDFYQYGFTADGLTNGYYTLEMVMPYEAQALTSNAVLYMPSGAPSAYSFGVLNNSNIIPFNYNGASDENGNVFNLSYHINSNGQIVIPASDVYNGESYARIVDNIQSWYIFANQELGINYIGVQAVSNNGVKVWGDGNTYSYYYENAPALEFDIFVDNADYFQVYLNSYCADVDSDSCYIFIDGQFVATYKDLPLRTNEWYSNLNSVYLSAGNHTVTIFAREDDYVLNEVCLVSSSGIAPSGTNMLDSTLRGATGYYSFTMSSPTTFDSFYWDIETYANAVQGVHFGIKSLSLTYAADDYNEIEEQLKSVNKSLKEIENQLYVIEESLTVPSESDIEELDKLDEEFKAAQDKADEYTDVMDSVDTPDPDEVMPEDGVDQIFEDPDVSAGKPYVFNILESLQSITWLLTMILISVTVGILKYIIYGKS